MSGVAFSCINTLTINYIIVVISPLSLTASWVISRWAEERWKERCGRNHCGAAAPFQMGAKGWACDPTHNGQYSWASAAGEFTQVILPWIEKKWKKKAPNRKKEESAPSCPSSSPSGSAYTAPPSWPTTVSGLGCAWAQSSMLFKQTNVQFEMPVALPCPS